MNDQPKPNSAHHEKLLSEAAKGMVGGLLDLSVTHLNLVIQRLEEEENDPLSLERFIHNADRLTLIADRLWDLGEKSYEKARHLYTHPQQKEMK